MIKIPLIVVAGATASGKTGLSIEIAKSLNGEIISADSMQIYKHMDIGTAKPTPEEQCGARHHLIDFVEPKDSFSVAEYCEMAHNKISEIYSENKLPIMCGGTGLYINSVVDDVDFGEMETDYKLREELFEIAKNEGNERLIEILSEFDELSAKKLHPNNVKRVVRAIEFYKKTGVPISEHQEETKKKESRYNPIMFAVDWDREELYDRINKRVDIMFRDGLLDEVKKLKDAGLKKEMQSMQGIGYKELFDYFDNLISLDEAIDAIKQGSRRYAKRQLTWFRRDHRIHWLSPGNAADKALEIITQNKTKP